ncbi:MAG: HAD family hydrolase [Flavobacteriaceae bacterium]
MATGNGDGAPRGGGKPARCVVFDVGRVLIDWQPAAFFAARIPDAARHRFFMEEVVPMEWHQEQDRGRSLAEGVRLRQQAYPAHAADIAAFYDNWLDTIPGSMPGMDHLLADLNAHDVPCHAITNFSAELWPLTVAAHPILSWLDEVVVSGEEGLLKPDPEIFALLLERISRPAADCVFVDDLAANVDAAAALGFDAILFSGADDLRRDLARRGLLG